MDNEDRKHMYRSVGQVPPASDLDNSWSSGYGPVWAPRDADRAAWEAAGPFELVPHKLLDDLLSFHCPDSSHEDDGRRPRCRACNEVCPCPTVRMIEAGRWPGLGSNPG
jgi:hypothetical protein